VCQLAWCSERALKDWQTEVTIPMHKQEDRSECTNYQRISLPSLPGKVKAKCLEKRCREAIEPELNDTQRSFCPGLRPTDQICTLLQIFEKS